jgi:hypothetical protein
MGTKAVFVRVNQRIEPTIYERLARAATPSRYGHSSPTRHQRTPDR